MAGAPEDKPFTAIWAAGAAFELWEAASGRCIHVLIPRGKLVVFRGDGGHCGGNLSTCLRVHVFGRRIGSELKAPGSVWEY